MGYLYHGYVSHSQMVWVMGSYMSSYGTFRRHHARTLTNIMFKANDVNPNQAIITMPLFPEIGGL